MSRRSVSGLRSSQPIAEQLPAVLRSDPLAASFVDGLDAVLAPVLLTVENLPTYVDPDVAPMDFVAWLASWFGLELDPSWSEERARETVRRIARLQRFRGTVRGLTELVEVLGGGSVGVEDGGGVWATLDPGAPLEGEHRPDVRVVVTGGDEGLRAVTPGLVRSYVPTGIRVLVESADS
jgi:phage tail-like protein